MDTSKSQEKEHKEAPSKGKGQDSSAQKQQGAKVASGESAPKAAPQEASSTPEKDWEKEYLYLRAEIENLRKRSQKERLDFLRYGHESLGLELLQVKDNLERALAHSQEAQKDSLSSLLEGLTMVVTQFSDTLGNWGIREVDCLDKPFDPHMHEAIEERHMEGKKEGLVIEVQQKGYLLHDRLLRPARTVVAKAEIEK